MEKYEMTRMTKNRKKKHISAAAAAALLMGSASAMAAIGEHDQERTDPTAAYEQQQEQDRQAQGQTGAQQQDDQWQDNQGQTGQAQRDQGQMEGQMGQAQVGAEQAGQQLEQLAQQHGNLSTFVRAVQEAGLAEALVGTTEYTIFAPTDEAFEQHDRSVEELLSSENREELISLLRAHIVADDVDPEMARSIGQALTIDGGTVQLQADQEQEGRFQVGQASVVDNDVQQNNLRIYPIDQVLQPSEFAAFEPGATDQDRDDGMMQRDAGTGTTGAGTEAERDQDMERDTDVDVDVDIDRDTQRDTDW
jgi:uncharacterized surface protein with fasciclin (FAS1) repeats